MKRTFYTYCLFTLAACLAVVKVEAQTFVVEDNALAAVLKEECPESHISGDTFSIDKAAQEFGILYARNKEIRDASALRFYTNIDEINIKDNHLTDFPNLSNFNRLDNLKISGNKLEEIDFIDEIAYDIYIDISYNLLTFEDILAVKRKRHANNVHYYPQYDTPVSDTVIRPFDEAKIRLVFDANIDSSTYQWFKNDTFIAFTNIPEINLGLFDHRKEGLYHCRISNSSVNDLIITTEKFEITVAEAIQAQQQACINADNLTKLTIKRDCFYGNTIKVQEESIINNSSSIDAYILLNNRTNEVLQSSSDKIFYYLKEDEYRLVVRNSDNCLDTTTVYNDYHTCDESTICFDASDFEQDIFADCSKGNILDVSDDDIKIGNSSVVIQLYDLKHQFIAEETDRFLNLKNDKYLLSITDENECFDTLTITNNYKPCEEKCFDATNLYYTLTPSNDCKIGSSFEIDLLSVKKGSTPLKINLSSARETIDLLEENNLSGLKADQYLLEISDSLCTEIVTISNDYQPCKKNIIITDNPDLNQFYLDIKGTTSIFSSDGALITRLNTPDYWDGTDNSGNLVPMGDYYFFGADTTGTISVFR